LDAFREGLRDLGYIEGATSSSNFGWPKEIFPVGRSWRQNWCLYPVAVILTTGFGGNVDPSGRIPVVAPALMDPVQRGFAVSLARPGGNITDFTLMHTALNAKRPELLRTAFPQITAVTALVNPANSSQKLAFEQTETAARSLGLGRVAKVEAESAAPGGVFRIRRGDRCPGRGVL
jgi:putative tryptophan/tyrosine transport system substrate-binding protein